MSIRKLPGHILENILFMAGYFESLVLLGSQIYADSKFQKLLLCEGGPGRILETTISRGGDIPTLLLLKPLIPSYIALTLSIKATKEIPIIKRICIIWDIYRSYLAYLVSRTDNFAWGVENLRESMPYEPYMVNRAYATTRQLEGMEPIADGPLKKVVTNLWLYEKLRVQVFDRLYMMKDIESGVLFDYIFSKLTLDTERIVDFQVMIQRMIYWKRFREAKQLLGAFEAEYGINNQVIENDLLKMGRYILDENDSKKTEYIQLLEYFGYPETSLYRAILFFDAQECLRLLRSNANFMLQSRIFLRNLDLLQCQGFYDQLTDEEFDAISIAVYGQTTPRSVDKSSSQLDIRKFYALTSTEKKLELIRDGVMTEWEYVTEFFLIRGLYGQLHSFTFLQAITETHGMDLLRSLKFQLPVGSKEDFFWLAKALIDTRHDGVAGKSMVVHATVSKGTVHYLDLRRDQQEIEWQKFYTKKYFTELLIYHLAFWNYYEDEPMFT